MAYLALYRRFRPNGFKGLIGQEHIVRTLANQISSGRIGHAYLFCGTRGTGKTSAAKIFAKAINCLSPVDGSPCGECEVCKALSDPSNLDILEMDAASNNKVENVREIREKIQYPPVSGRYKVYIIDEVHMLTTEAFNALLKTLEEPPKHAVFILATTESHKLPSTILSRCMRFDFRIIPTKDIANLIAGIYDEIGKEYDKDAVMAIARAGAGSARDALSIADICVSYRDSKLTYSDVLEVLGATDSSKITSMISKIVTADTSGTLEDVEELCETGKSIGVLCKDIISRLREVVICKTCKNARDILELPEDVYGELCQIADKADGHRLLRVIEIFTEAEGSLRYSLNPRVVLESACIKASQPENDYNIDALLSRINSLEEQIKNASNVVYSAPAKVIDVEKTQPQKVESKPKAKVESDYPSFDEGYPEAPPEDDFGGGFYGDISKSKKADNRPIAPRFEEKPIEKPKERPVAEEKREPSKEDLKPTPLISGGKLWGRVIRQLRLEKNIVLWVACQEMDAKLVGKTLRIIANDDAGYQAVVKENNLAILSKTVKSIGDYDIEIVKAGEEKVDTFTSEVEKVKKTFSGVTVNVEE
ncbi:MAG: DNA polymerase III subunit gamma/tau [Clostridia bacterium]|nr:DNA polymerase III subunit gamma/tau [Clostridia bacterium]